MVFTGTTEKTNCGGEVSYTINKASQTVTARLSQVKMEDKQCSTCMFNKMCQQLFSKAVQNAKTIQVLAFSGMSIGELPITKGSKDHIEVTTNKGQKLKFDKKTGLQTNAKNPKYANRILIEQPQTDTKKEEGKAV